MPTITRDVMDQEELKEFSEASREILLAQADGYCRLEVDGDSPGEYGLRNLESNQARGYKGKELDRAIRLVEQKLNSGGARTGRRANGAPLIETATVTNSHHYPKEYMDEGEENRFNADIGAINAAMGRRECSFETLLDDEAHIFFRYSVQPGSENRDRTMESISNVVDMVHAGKAVRVEMPGGGTMLTPRLRMGENTGQKAQQKAGAATPPEGRLRRDRDRGKTVG